MAATGTDTLHPSLRPPECVKGMTSLTTSKFNKTVKVPGIKLPKKQISLTQKSWKRHLLKMRGLKPIANLDSKDPLQDTHNLILLDPAKIEDQHVKAELVEQLKRLGFPSDIIEHFELEIGYENWSVSQIMRAILPKDAENVSSFSQIGHIAHLNLKEENLPYKQIIGQVLLDKIPSVKTVVNKLNSIDNTYRNFEMELLAGEDNFITQTREHNCVFELDFSKVYWNSRLSTEHQRIVDLIPKQSVVYDVFAGVGPFTVPLSKKKNCTIFANDLNPHSFKSLERNIELNKLNSGSVKAFNMDGRDFILDIMKSDLIQRIKALNFEHQKSREDNPDKTILQKEESETVLSSETSSNEMCVSTFAVMNLPAIAVDFLDAFVSLLGNLPEEFHNPQVIDLVLPTIYCYAFCAKSDDMEIEVKKRAETVLGHSLPFDTTVRLVRNVSPNKEMVCLSFKLWPELVLSNKNTSVSTECYDPKAGGLARFDYTIYNNHCKGLELLYEDESLKL